MFVAGKVDARIRPLGYSYVESQNFEIVMTEAGTTGLTLAELALHAGWRLPSSYQ